MSTIAAVIGRILIASIFIVMGAGIISDPARFEQTITSVGMPAGLALPVGLFEVVAGLCIALGLMTRLMAILLFVFVGLVALMFHFRPGSPEALTMLLFDLAIMGGLLMIFAHSQMWWSVDAMRRDRRGERLAREAEERAHAAELRAAHAEGAAEALHPPRDVPRPRRRWW